MCLKRLNYDRKELERRREDSAQHDKGQLATPTLDTLVDSSWQSVVGVIVGVKNLVDPE